MCGVAGIITDLSLEYAKTTSLILKDSIFHRGQDDDGIEIRSINKDTNISLIHTRLSILDLSKKAHQPMIDDYNKNVLVFNGEIYNYLYLRKLLIESNYQFKSNSDTEVILYAYDKWGAEFLKYLEGMFSLCIWDHSKKKFFLAVDPLGIKPLYWGNNDNTFFFCSELRPLLKSNLSKKNLDYLSIDSYLAYGSVQGPDTIIEDIKILQGGHYLIIDSNRKLIKKEQYWNLNFKNKLKYNYKDTISKLNKIISKVNKQHLLSDVPIGIFLSGGVDSSALAYFSSKNKENINSFSVDFEEKDWSEGDFSKKTAEKLKINHTEITLSEEKLKLIITRAVSSLDQPSIDGINVFALSELVRKQGIKVAISGQGGDEIFAGYSTFKHLPLIVKFNKILRKMPKIFKKLIKYFFLITIDFKRVLPSKLLQLIKYDHSVVDSYFLLRQLLPFETRKKLLNSKSCSRNALNKVTQFNFSNDIRGLDLIDTVSYLELKCYLGQTLLRDSDVMGMANNLEIRVPFLDKRIIEFVCSIPPSFKVDNKRPKPLLLDATYGNVEKRIWNKKKQGFTFPWEKWLRNDLKFLGEQTFEDEIFWKKFGFNFNELKKMWLSFLSHRRGVTWPRIWVFIVFRSWCKENL